MRKLLIIGILGFVAWKGYGRYVNQSAAVDSGAVLEESDAVEQSDAFSSLMPSSQTPEDSSFKCDGRKYCSQMTSCAEAMYFLENCPGVRMDGSGPGQDGPGDGIPCEKQWCGPREKPRRYLKSIR
jgi:Tfp pilus assembly protein PilE